MGAWGSGLYANDSTCDVRDSYISYLQEGLNNTDAYDKIRKEYDEYIGDQDEPFFWFALAETQWRLGRLQPEVKEKAIEWIEKDGGLELWEESANGGAGWKKTLQKLKEKLESPMPKEKKVRKPQVFNNNLWNVNDVYAYQFHEEESKQHGIYGKYMLLQKIGEDKELYTGKILMRIQVFDRIFDDLPTLDDMDGGIRILPLDDPDRVFNKEREPFWTNTLIGSYRKIDYPSKYLTFIGNKQGPINNMMKSFTFAWVNIEDWLYKFYRHWNELEYETLGEGVFRYIHKQ